MAPLEFSPRSGSFHCLLCSFRLGSFCSSRVAVSPAVSVLCPLSFVLREDEGNVGGTPNADWSRGIPSGTE